MSNGKHIQCGEIWLVDFDPSTGHEFQKQRPALVIQAAAQIRKSNVVTIMPLTSNLSNTLPDDITIKKSEKNKLLSDSVLKVYNIVSFDYSRFIKKIGDVDAVDLDRVKEYLLTHFGISDNH